MDRLDVYLMECIVMLADDPIWTWKVLARSSPRFGRYTLKNKERFMQLMRPLFTCECTLFHSRYYIDIKTNMRVLPCVMSRSTVWGFYNQSVYFHSDRREYCVYVLQDEREIYLRRGFECPERRYIFIFRAAGLEGSVYAHCPAATSASDRLLPCQSLTRS